ncbi:hypothetical protein CCP4SC76_7560002 [Gammaproteobacteria bacterium]
MNPEENAAYPAPVLPKMRIPYGVADFWKLRHMNEWAHSFEDYIRIELMGFFEHYPTQLDASIAERVMAETRSDQKLKRLFLILAELNLPLYLFIDEYDNFANTLLVTEGQQIYQEMTHGGGSSASAFP